MSVGLISNAKALDALVLFVEDSQKLLTKITDPSLQNSIQRPLKNDFKGRWKETLLVYPEKSPIAERVLLIGVGKTKSLTAHQIRTLGATAVHHLKNVGVTKNAAIAIPAGTKLSSSELAQAFTEGQILFQLGFDRFKTEKKEEDKARREKLSLALLLSDKKDLKIAEAGAARGKIIADDVNWARTLIQLPGGDLYPEKLVEETQKMVAASPSKSKIKAQYWNTKELEKNKFGGVLGVGQGSNHPPYFIILEYFQGKKSDAPVVLVGKGITFDSGGLSLKPPASMETMKYDMAGSASVLAAFKIITDLKLKVNLVALVPTAENMPSGHAIRPGDVLRMASGKTVEVLNTDAEGRLILADALHYATSKYKPKAVIDVATLTGACAVAVGEAAVGLFTNNKKLESALMNAAGEVQENLWPLPDFEDFYAAMIKSDIADIKNTGGREAGASTASIFLRHFVHNNTPWAHFDIAGCGWYDSPRDFIGSRGASGVSIRTMAEFVESHATKSF
ncbi:MAG: putative cytosol aminopeptidase [Bacteriovoracaceae bacterium]|nr:putative cytosol aminopeptidase [Bacteriovoracaceae bacterium]